MRIGTAAHSAGPSAHVYTQLVDQVKVLAADIWSNQPQSEPVILASESTTQHPRPGNWTPASIRVHDIIEFFCFFSIFYTTWLEWRKFTRKKKWHKLNPSFFKASSVLQMEKKTAHFDHFLTFYPINSYISKKRLCTFCALVLLSSVSKSEKHTDYI